MRKTGSILVKQIKGRSLEGEIVKREIEPVVLLLRKSGIGTIASGGYESGQPYVLCESTPVHQVADILIQAGFDSGFTISEKYTFVACGRALIATEISFWMPKSEFLTVIESIRESLEE